MLLPYGLLSTYLLRTIPSLPAPLLVQEKLVVLVGNDSWGESPRSRESGAIGVATSKSVGTAESDNLLVIEAHSAEDITQVRVSLRGIWESSIRCASSHLLVHSARSVGNNRSAHLLNSNNTSKDPKITVCQPWVLRYLSH